MGRKRSHHACVLLSQLRLLVTCRTRVPAHAHRQECKRPRFHRQAGARARIRSRGGGREPAAERGKEREGARPTDSQRQLSTALPPKKNPLTVCRNLYGRRKEREARSFRLTLAVYRSQEQRREGGAGANMAGGRHVDDELGVQRAGAAGALGLCAQRLEACQLQYPQVRYLVPQQSPLISPGLNLPGIVS